MLRPLWFDAKVACLRKGRRALTLCWPVKTRRASGRRALSGADALGADVSYVRVGVLVGTVCIVPGRAKSTAACICTIAVAVASTVIAAAALVTSTAAVSATAIVASPVHSGASSIAGFRDSESAFQMGQDCVIELDDHRTAHGDH